MTSAVSYCNNTKNNRATRVSHAALTKTSVSAPCDPNGQNANQNHYQETISVFCFFSFHTASSYSRHQKLNI